MPLPDLRRIAFVGTYVPRRCGIATFTRDLRCVVAGLLPRADCPVVAMHDATGGDDHPEEVRFQCGEADPQACERAAEFLNLANVDVVSLQHEYGIFGGEAGGHVLALLRNVRAPVHTTLHTVLARPTPAQRQVMREVIHLSARLAVMTRRGLDLLQEVYGVPNARVDVIPHGIPDAPPADPDASKARLGLAGTRVLLTFGLLSPGKGIESVIAALPEIAARHPDVTYLVVGATHPHLLREDGEGYRQRLERLAAMHDVRDRVVFHDRFVTTPELVAFLGAADVYITPYVGEDQITSGTLAYAFGCGKAVLSTPYWHARELLADGRGVLVPFTDPAAIAREVCGLLADEPRRRAMCRQAWLLGREMVWPRIAERFLEAFGRTRLATAVKPRGPVVPGPARLPRHRLPSLVLDHLLRLTDSTGLVQHAVHDVPNRAEGYCTDDNARGLALMVNVEGLGLASPATGRATAVYAAFLEHAFVPGTGRFRNFLGFDRRWLDAGGSDDCLGRSVLALGTCIGRSARPGLRRWAMRLFEPALRAAAATTSPRAWAQAILGAEEYLQRLGGDRLAAGIQRGLVARLLELHRRNAGPDWPWFEDVVTYDNARPCEALIVGGLRHGDTAAVEAGLGMLAWLCDVQRSPTGRFAPVGCRGFLRRGGTAAPFDQQPLEAQATIGGCLAAFRAVGEPVWIDRAWNAFDWFHGHNVLGEALCDPHTGGCRDGLLEDRANENQGAESTLAYLGSLVDVKRLETTVPELPCRQTCPAPG